MRTQSWLNFCLALALTYCLASTAAAQPCTPADPCDVTIAFLTTERGRAEFEAGAERYARKDSQYTECIRRQTAGACYLAQISDRLTGELARAFVASGISGPNGKSVRLKALPIWTSSVDTEALQPIVKDGAAAYNAAVMRRLYQDPAAKEALTRANLAVVFQEYRSGRICTFNALQSGRYLVLSACLTNDRRGLLTGQFLHEIGHAFGAGHNRDAKLQPCGHSYACAFKHEGKGGAFCTLTGQWDQSLTNGCAKLGYVKEYSHPGACTTRPGVPCGSAREDNARRIRECLIPIARARRHCDPWWD
jgi:hypothetical protein